LSLLPFAHAIDDEFPGFHHFQAWDGAYVDLQPEDARPLFGGAIDLSVAKDLCATVGPCYSFAQDPSHSGPTNFRGKNGNNDYDIYLGLNNTGAVCAVRSYESRLLRVFPRFLLFFLVASKAGGSRRRESPGG
jgi:hypothetical protein